MRAVRQSLLVFGILLVGMFLIGLRIGERSSVPPPSQVLRVPSPVVTPNEAMALPPLVIAGPSQDSPATEILEIGEKGTLRIGSSLSSPIARERQIRNVFLRKTASGYYSAGALQIEFDDNGYIAHIVLPQEGDLRTEPRRSQFFLVFAHEISPILFPEFYTQIVKSRRYDRCASVTLKHNGNARGFFVACLYMPPPVVIA